jgi:hypothetical protein
MAIIVFKYLAIVAEIGSLIERRHREYEIVVTSVQQQVDEQSSVTTVVRYSEHVLGMNNA